MKQAGLRLPLAMITLRDIDLLDMRRTSYSFYFARSAGLVLWVARGVED